jgi:hypothetical protein
MDPVPVAAKVYAVALLAEHWKEKYLLLAVSAAQSGAAT